MFTALFVTKFALNCFYEMGFEDAKFYGCRKDMKTRPFLKFRKLYFALSLVIILAGVGSMVHNQSSMGVPLNYSMEFRGGTSTNVTFNEDMSLEDISSQVVPVVEKITGEAGTDPEGSRKQRGYHQDTYPEHGRARRVKPGAGGSVWCG